MFTFLLKCGFSEKLVGHFLVTHSGRAAKDKGGGGGDPKENVPGPPSPVDILGGNMARVPPPNILSSPRSTDRTSSSF